MDNVGIYIYTFTFMAMMDNQNDKSMQVIVSGLVQGVGFRPFVYRIATGFDLTGWVQNTNENVRIEVSGTSLNISHFLLSLRKDAPRAARIEDISAQEMEPKTFSEFRILNSHNISEEITEISPDIAVCNECLQDMDQPGNRLDYAFVNCTNCGPRFTIIQDLPYDRAKTTMKSFAMCPDCRNEYETITDRRFHAQPTACRTCGPEYELFEEQIRISTNIQDIVDRVSECIESGGLVMIKGLGGMHLACDAFNKAAVERLRELKNREGKPFAVMFRNLESLKLYAEINAQEEQSLVSWQRPIVLLEKKESADQNKLAKSLNSGLNLLGVMLPYMPFHYLLFSRLKTSAIVLTSGNFSSEPILIDNQLALDQFSPLVDAVVLHNRDIFNRTDDSVVRIIAEKERIFRRSRGYVPAPVRTSLNTEGIVAFGAELTNCFCVGKGKKAFLSQHIGDLQGLETALFYEKTIAQFIQIFRIKPSLLAVDMHPSYISTKTGMHSGDLPVVQVQHHHAHIASCMAEHRLDEKVIGVALDGTGYGPDGNIWGSEFLICDLNEFVRFTHFEYMPMPGGDGATEEPWRMAVSYLYRVYGKSFLQLELPLLKQIDPDKIKLIIQMIDQKINCPLTSGAGRLFDCVASLLNLVQVAAFQAEGPMRLEAALQKKCFESYVFELGQTIRFDKTIRGIVEDIRQNIEVPTISAKFHNTIVLAIFESVNAIRMKEGISKVVLSGGVFQNKYLLEKTIGLLEKNNFEVYSHAAVPTNDGGIALGQLAVASKRRELLCV
ncbi:MAG: carbamoyltransferase HypF [Bacteroidota bacterium]|nr:carbamoyltransferase HypF [Bacteroidota bacterium]